MKKRAFTMAEAILTMVILGVIASIMIANLKPVQYRNEGFKVTGKKIHAELDEVLNTIAITCASGMDLTKVYNDCSVKNGTADGVHAFGAAADDGDLLKQYIRDKGNCGSTPEEYESSFKTKNGACIALKSGEIWIDVNDTQGPNQANLDQITITVGSDGMVIPEILEQ